MSFAVHRAAALALLASGVALSPASQAQPSGASWRSGNLIARWAQPTLSTQPPSSTDPAMGSASGVVLFGGSQNGTPGSETWQWDGASWTKASPTNQPPARSNHALATLGKNLVLFGGAGAGSLVLGDTWEWDGTNWSNKNPGNAPSARQGHSMALFIGSKMVVLLFGGLNGTGVRQGDTWLWDGSGWSSPAPGTSPSPRADHALATLGPKVILFGGQDVGGYSNETWEWDGTTWSKRAPVSSPPARARHAMTTWQSRVVLYGGTGAGGPLQDTWEWDGTNWTEMNASPAPSARAGHAMALHTAGVVMFGGTAAADTWTYHSGLDNGSACAKANDCAYGNCVDSVCCDLDCLGQCESCATPGKLGSCQPVAGSPVGGRPRCVGEVTCTTHCDAGDDACAPNCEAGTDPCRGTCDGVNRIECTYPSDASVCEPAGCTGGQERTDGLCNGLGLCIPGKKTSCGDYTCGAATCKTTCANASDCVPGGECDAGSCFVAGGGGYGPDGGDGGEEPDASLSDDTPAAAESSDGCGCRTAGAGGSWLGWWLLLAGLTCIRGRRSRRA